MSEPKYTHGDWKAVCDCPVSIVSGDICIAVIEDSGGYQSPAEQRSANARLIAASPSLLSACQAALAELEKVWVKDTPTIARLREAIKEAL